MFSRLSAAYSAFRGGNIREGFRALTFADMFGNSTVDLDAQNVDPNVALRVASVFACVKVISETIGTLPLHLHRQVDDKTTRRETKHRTAGWLNDAPNGKMTWPEAREAFVASLVLRGNGFGQVGWRGGYPYRLDPLEADKVTVSQTDDRLVYAYYPDNGAEIELRAPQMLHAKGLSFHGLLGLSPVSACSYAFTTAKAQQAHGANVFSNGARMTGILTIPAQSFKNEAIRKAMRADWEAQVKKARDGAGTAILTEGTQYAPVSMSLADAQFIEAQNLSTEQIASIFRVPLHKIQHLQHATFSNIEHQDLEYYKDTLLPWLVKLEAAYNAVLLTKRDREDGLFFRHNVEGILRGDFATRADGYQKAIVTGWMTRNEARAKEKMPPIEGGDKPLVPLNMGGEPPPDAKPKRSLEPLAPMIDEVSRAMGERIKKAFERAKGKPDEAERLDKFLDDHRRALTQRLTPLLESVESLGYAGAKDALGGIVERHLQSVSASICGAGDIVTVKTLLEAIE